MFFCMAGTWCKIRIKNARRILMSEWTSSGAKRWCAKASQDDMAAAYAITCWRLFGWYFKESWTLSPYWAAAFCSFPLVYLRSANISKIFLAVCWVSTSNCSIHFLRSPCDPLLGCWSLMTGLEGFITSSAVKAALGGGLGSGRRTQASRPRWVLAFGLAPNAAAVVLRFLEGAAVGWVSSNGSMGSSGIRKRCFNFREGWSTLWLLWLTEFLFRFL